MKQAFLSLLFIAFAVAQPTRPLAAQVAFPTSTEYRLAVVAPNGVLTYVRLDPASLVLVPGQTTNDPPTLKAITNGSTPATAPLKVYLATFDATANDGTFTWTGTGSILTVIRNGAVMRPPLTGKATDYEITSASSIRFTVDSDDGKTKGQGWTSADSVLILAQ